MPRTKQRSVRRAKHKSPYLSGPRKPPRRSGPRSSLPAIVSTTSADPCLVADATSATPSASTASERKLCTSPYAHIEHSSSSSGSDSEGDGREVRKGAQVLEVAGIQTALKAVCCKECGSGPVMFEEDLHKRVGLCTHPYLLCQNCQARTDIPFAKAGSRSLAVNRRTALANKCIGGSFTTIETLFAVLDLPPPVSQHAYQQHMKVVATGAAAEANDSMCRARQEIRDLYDASSEDVIDILVSCNGTWQKRGFLSLFGAVFVIAYETGKVMDFIVLSKHCSGCKR